MNEMKVLLAHYFVSRPRLHWKMQKIKMLEYSKEVTSECWHEIGMSEKVYLGRPRLRMSCGANDDDNDE